MSPEERFRERLMRRLEQRKPRFIGKSKTYEYSAFYIEHQVSADNQYHRLVGGVTVGNWANVNEVATLNFNWRLFGATVNSERLPEVFLVEPLKEKE